MKATYPVLAVALAGIVIGSSGCAQLRARDNLNKGSRAFKASQYSAAVELFKKAVDADPSFTAAHLYLGMAYYMQFVPGSESAENQQLANQAMATFNKVLELDPKNETAAQSIASLYYNQKKFDESAKWNHRVLEINPQNKEAYYTLGLLAWTNWLPIDRQARIDSKMRVDEPGPIKDAKIREPLKEKWLPVLDQGIKDEEQALKIDPEYDDAMAYMNLLIRYRADLLDTPADYKAESLKADNWMAKSLETKTAKAKRKSALAEKGVTKAE